MLFNHLINSFDKYINKFAFKTNLCYKDLLHIYLLLYLHAGADNNHVHRVLRSNLCIIPGLHVGEGR